MLLQTLSPQHDHLLHHEDIRVQSGLSVRTAHECRCKGPNVVVKDSQHDHALHHETESGLHTNVMKLSPDCTRMSL